MVAVQQIANSRALLKALAITIFAIFAMMVLPPTADAQNELDAAAVEAGLGLDRPVRRQIQLALQAAGFDPGVADGLFGSRTRAAIRSWQTSRRLRATGYLDGASVAALRPPAVASRTRDPAGRVGNGSRGRRNPVIQETVIGADGLVRLQPRGGAAAAPAPRAADRPGGATGDVRTEVETRRSSVIQEAVIGPDGLVRLRPVGGAAATAPARPEPRRGAVDQESPHAQNNRILETQKRRAEEERRLEAERRAEEERRAVVDTRETQRERERQRQATDCIVVVREGSFYSISNRCDREVLAWYTRDDAVKNERSRLREAEEWLEEWLDRTPRGASGISFYTRLRDGAQYFLAQLSDDDSMLPWLEGFKFGPYRVRFARDWAVTLDLTWAEGDPPPTIYYCGVFDEDNTLGGDGTWSEQCGQYADIDALPSFDR